MNNKMKIVDFHMHPGPRWLPTERRLHKLNIQKNFGSLISVMDKAGIDKAITMLLDEDWFRTNRGKELTDICNEYKWNERLIFCAMFDIFRIFETKKTLKDIENAFYLGVQGIKIHPTIQRISKLDFPLIKPLVKIAEYLGMFIVVHAYSEDASNYNNIGIEIVNYIGSISDIQIVTAHAGGIDFSRLVFLAQKYPKVYIDLSYFFNINSILESNELLKWGIQSLGADRFLYGSDHPSCNAILYKNYCINNLELIGVQNNEIEKIMGKNAYQIINT